MTLSALLAVQCQSLGLLVALQAKYRRKLCEALATGLRGSIKIWQDGGPEYVHAKLGVVFQGIAPALEAVVEGWQSGRSIETACSAIADVLSVLAQAKAATQVREGRSFGSLFAQNM
jgi:hypothetical protein